ncbi:MAG: hypothetical protein ABIB71_04290 [Candidatus Woesearchaeota archaeon]
MLEDKPKVNEPYEVDISNQISNPWDEDTVIAMVKGGFKFSIKIKTEIKLRLKEEFYHDIPKRLEEKHLFKTEKNANNIVSSLIHAYLIHKLVVLNPTIGGDVKVCPDTRPVTKIEKYFTRACTYFDSDVKERVRLKFRKGKKVKGKLEAAPRSKANRTALKVMRNKKARSYHLSQEDLRELQGFIRSLYHKQKFK